MKAAAYIRVSTAEQEDGASLTEQKRDIAEYCNLISLQLSALTTERRLSHLREM